VGTVSSARGGTVGCRGVRFIRISSWYEKSRFTVGTDGGGFWTAAISI